MFAVVAWIRTFFVFDSSFFYQNSGPAHDCSLVFSPPSCLFFADALAVSYMTSFALSVILGIVPPPLAARWGSRATLIGKFTLGALLVPDGGNLFLWYRDVDTSNYSPCPS